MSHHRRKRHYRARRRERARYPWLANVAPGAWLSDWRNASVGQIIANVDHAIATVKPLPACPVCGKASDRADTLCLTCARSANALGVFGCRYCGAPMSRRQYEASPDICPRCTPF